MNAPTFCLQPQPRILVLGLGFSGDHFIKNPSFQETKKIDSPYKKRVSTYFQQNQVHKKYTVSGHLVVIQGRFIKWLFHKGFSVN